MKELIVYGGDIDIFPKKIYDITVTWLSSDWLVPAFDLTLT